MKTYKSRVTKITQWKKHGDHIQTIPYEILEDIDRIDTCDKCGCLIIEHAMIPTNQMIVEYPGILCPGNFIIDYENGQCMVHDPDIFHQMFEEDNATTDEAFGLIENACFRIASEEK